MITFLQLKNGAIKYLDLEMLNKIQDMTTKILVGAFLIATEQKMESLFNSIKDNQIIKAYGLIDEKGNIDIDMAYDCLKKSMNNNNIEFNLPILGKTTLTPTDIEKIHTYMVQADDSAQPPMFY